MSVYVNESLQEIEVPVGRRDSLTARDCGSHSYEKRNALNIELSESEIAFRDEFRSWIHGHLEPEWLERNDRQLSARECRERVHRFERAMGNDGWLGVAWPREYGGRDASLVEQVIYQEELARAEAPDLSGGVGLSLVAPVLMEVGTDEQKRRFLPPILRGEEVWCQGFSEPNAGSDLASMQTRAVPSGDHFVVTGQKIWSSFGDHADWCALLARTDPDAPKHRGISFLLVDMKTPGIEVGILKDMTAQSELNQIFFDGVRVPAANVLGPLNEGWRVATRLLTYERGTMAFGFLVGYERVWRRLRDHARKHRRDGQLLVEDPHFREKLARCYENIELMKLANLRWLTQYIRGAIPQEETSYMKLYWVQAAQGLTDLSLELVGVDALELPLDIGSRDGILAAEWGYARASSIYGGTQDIQRNIIAERIFGLPR